MNSPPYGGSCTYVASATPVVELEATVKLEAKNWQDDATDKPLEYSFGYVETGSTNTIIVPLAGKSLQDEVTWAFPEAGTWTMFCFIYDAVGAKTVAEVELVVAEGGDIDASKGKQLNEQLLLHQAEANNDAMVQMAGSVGSKLNKAGEQRRRRRLAEDVVDAAACPAMSDGAAVRTNILRTLAESPEQQSTQPDATLALCNAVSSLGGDPCELTEDAQEAGAAISENLVANSVKTGEFAEGAPGMMLNGMGAFISATVITVSPTNSSNSNSSNSSAQQIRAARLGEAAKALSIAVLQTIEVGEEQLSYGGNGLVTNLQVAPNAAALEGKPFQAGLPGDDQAASFTLAPGTLGSVQDQGASQGCRLRSTGSRRLQRGRRRMADGGEEQNVGITVTTYEANVHNVGSNTGD